MNDKTIIQKSWRTLEGHLRTHELASGDNLRLIMEKGSQSTGFTWMCLMRSFWQSGTARLCV